MKKARLAPVLGSLVFLAGCFGEPSPILNTRVELPAGTKADNSRLHLIQNGYAAYADPTPASVARAKGNGFDVQMDLGIGPRIEVKLHVWYDVNGNGIEDHGDLAGDLSPSPFTAIDNGKTRMNYASPIALRVIP